MDAPADPLRREQHVVAGQRHRGRIVDSAVEDHPVQLVVADDLQRSRLTVFFRLLLAMPFVWIGLWSFAVFFAAIVAWFAALVVVACHRACTSSSAMYVRYTPTRPASRSRRTRTRDSPAAWLPPRRRAPRHAGSASRGGRSVSGSCSRCRRSSSPAARGTGGVRRPVGGGQASPRSAAASSAGSRSSRSAGCRRTARPRRLRPRAWRRPTRTRSSSRTAIRTPTPTRSARAGTCATPGPARARGRQPPLAPDGLLPAPLRDPPLRLARTLGHRGVPGRDRERLVALVPRPLRGRGAPVPRRIPRYYAHVTAFVTLVANPFPGFTGDPATRSTS